MIKYNDAEIFFFDDGLKTAYKRAEEFINRNKGKITMKLYYLTNKPKPFPRWEYIKTIKKEMSVYSE